MITVLHLLGELVDIGGELGTLSVIACENVEWIPDRNAQRLNGPRVEVEIINPATSSRATYARVFPRDVFLLGGGALAVIMPGPDWWERTEAEARELVGLPPLA